MISYKFRIPPFSNYVVITRFHDDKVERRMIRKPADCQQLVKLLYKKEVSEEAARRVIWSYGLRGKFIRNRYMKLYAFFDNLPHPS